MAVYIGGKQVSTSEFNEAVARLWKDTDIMFKIKPTKMFVGQKAEQFEVWGRYQEARTTCSGGLNAHVRQTEWGANMVDGKLVVAPSGEYLAAHQAVKRYGSVLTRFLESPTRNSTARSLAVRELAALEAVLAGEVYSPASAFHSTEKERGSLPTKVFDARLNFLDSDPQLAGERLSMFILDIRRR